MKPLKVISRYGKAHKLLPKLFEFDDNGNVVGATYRFVAAEKWMPFYVTQSPDSEDIMMIDTDGGPALSIDDEVGFVFEGEEFHFKIDRIYNEGNGFMLHLKNFIINYFFIYQLSILIIPS